MLTLEVLNGRFWLYSGGIESQEVTEDSQEGNSSFLAPRWRHLRSRLALMPFSSASFEMLNSENN